MYEMVGDGPSPVRPTATCSSPSSNTSPRHSSNSCRRRRGSCIALRKALQKDAGRRYQTSRDLWLDLRALDDGLGASTTDGEEEATTPPESSPMTDDDRRFRRRPSIPTIAVLATLAVLGAATLALVYSRKAPPQSPSGQLVTSGAVQHTLRQLTREPGRQRGVTWSSDNHTIAFSSNRSGNSAFGPDAWVQPSRCS